MLILFSQKARRKGVAFAEKSRRSIKQNPREGLIERCRERHVV